MADDVLLQSLEAACAFLNSETQARGEPWRARVYDVSVERSEATRTLRATVTLELVSSETMLRAAQVRVNPSGRAMAMAQHANNPVRARVSPGVAIDAAMVEGVQQQFRRHEDALMHGNWDPKAHAWGAEDRAGARALLEKYAKGIQHAIELARGGDPSREAKNAAFMAQKAREKDPVAMLLLAVQSQRERVEKALKGFQAQMEKLKAQANENPEEALRRRIRLKVRAQYENEERMLREFQNFLWVNYSALLPEHQKPNAVPDFLQHIEDSDDAY